MTAAAALKRDAPTTAAESLFGDVMGGEPTLAEVIAGVWEGLTAHGRAACPVCGASAMQADLRSGGTPRGGRCSACGSRIA